MDAAVDRSRLASALREVLLTPAQQEAIAVHGSTDAGVLVPLFVRDGDLHVVFTKRHEDLAHHPGEISFPGGRADDDDCGDLCVTALREAEEEIGLAHGGVDVVGALPPTATFVTSYAIYPYVGLIEPDADWTTSEAEVAQVLEFRLADVRDGYALTRLVRRGMPFRTATYTVDGNMIWGATARIVGELLARVEPLLER